MTDVWNKYSNRELIKDLVRFVSPYKKKFWLGTIIRLLSDLVWLYPAIAVGWLINMLTEQGADIDFTQVFIILGFFVLASVIHYMGRDYAKYQIYQVAERAGIDASYETLEHLISLDIAWQEKENSGNKLKRIMHGNEGINSIIRLYVDLVIESAVNTVFIITIFTTFDWLIAGAMSLYVFCYYFFSLTLLRKAKEQSHIVNIREEQVQGEFFEIINNMTTVKWMGLEGRLLKSFKKVLQKLVDEIRLRIKYFRRRSASLGVFNEVFRVTLLGYIVYGVTQGNYGPGLLAIFLNYFTKMQLAADELAWVSSEFIIKKLRINRMMEILYEEPKVELAGHLPFPQKWKNIQLKNLSFSYEGKKYLHDINLNIKRGQKIGIVGLSGAGKTTLFKLMLKLYADYEGEILYDDVELKDIKRKHYLKHTAVVLQDTEVFNLSLADNILLSGKKKNKTLLKKAMDIAHISEFLHKLPQGENTFIGEKGVKLSGGEKQRVGIARAIYKQPQVLFLDEATSHLDIDSEQMIQDSFHHFFEGVTAIVIAHRLSTIKEMDKIVVMKSGKVVEQGDFHYLMKKEGEFWRLWQKQLKKEKKRETNIA